MINLGVANVHYHRYNVRPPLVEESKQALLRVDLVESIEF